MKAGEIRDLSPDERQRKIDGLKEEYFNLRFQHSIGQLENPQKIRQTRRDIARIKTVVRESEIKGRGSEA